MNTATTQAAARTIAFLELYHGSDEALLDEADEALSSIHGVEVLEHHVYVATGKPAAATMLAALEDLEGSKHDGFGNLSTDDHACLSPEQLNLLLGMEDEWAVSKFVEHGDGAWREEVSFEATGVYPSFIGYTAKLGPIEVGQQVAFCCNPSDPESLLYSRDMLQVEGVTVTKADDTELDYNELAGMFSDAGYAIGDEANELEELGYFEGGVTELDLDDEDVVRLPSDDGAAVRFSGHVVHTDILPAEATQAVGAADRWSGLAGVSYALRMYLTHGGRFVCSLRLNSIRQDTPNKRYASGPVGDVVEVQDWLERVGVAADKAAFLANAAAKAMLGQVDPVVVKARRTAAGLSQTAAAELVGLKLRGWQNYEAGDSTPTPAVWELFLLRTGAHPLLELVDRGAR